MADLNVHGVQHRGEPRTGKGLEETTEIMRRLKDEGDFFTDEGRWTLDVAGYPVLHKGWKDDRAQPADGVDHEFAGHRGGQSAMGAVRGPDRHGGVSTALVDRWIARGNDAFVYRRVGASTYSTTRRHRS
jgi:hypothetical protein